MFFGRLIQCNFTYLFVQLYCISDNYKEILKDNMPPDDLKDVGSGLAWSMGLNNKFEGECVSRFLKTMGPLEAKPVSINVE